jgi:endonuclease/exonuclease/phosphatase family metal-dependent hydrolase
MTFNLRVASPGDGINEFFLRTPRVLKAIRDKAPDLIGFQEDVDDMRAFLRKNLPEYTILGCGCHSDYHSVGNSIVYKTERFQLIDFETGWLSNTPKIPGSTYGGDQSKYPRSYHRARLHDTETGRVYQFVNLHADHVGANAKLSATKQILGILKPYADESIFVCGDLNSRPGTPSICAFSEDPDVRLVNVTAQVGGTYHGYGTCEPWQSDYIFSNLPCVESHRVEDVPENGVYISDHNPVVATFSV